MIFTVCKKFVVDPFSESSHNNKSGCYKFTCTQAAHFLPASSPSPLAWPRSPSPPLRAVMFIRLAEEAWLRADRSSVVRLRERTSAISGCRLFCLPDNGVLKAQTSWKLKKPIFFLFAYFEVIKIWVSIRKSLSPGCRWPQIILCINM